MTWSKNQIRAARKIPLAPLLRQKGVPLRELPGENYLVQADAKGGQAFGDLIVRDCYWIWKSRQLQGNTIDFFVMVENRSFAEAMNAIFGSPKLANPDRHPKNISNLPS